MLFGNDRRAMREVFATAWRRDREGQPLEPLHARIADVVREHPEYHQLLSLPGALDRDFEVAAGEVNPFLHLSMHLAVVEQVETDRPPGMRAAYARLVERLGSAHAADHAAMECLGRCLREAQSAGRAPDERAFLACVGRLAD